jgi:hypothetical protein
VVQNVTSVGFDADLAGSNGYTALFTNCIGATMNYCAAASNYNITSGNCCAEGACDSTTPSYTNAGAFDYSLQSSDTVAMDHGADLSATFTSDIDGDTRPQPTGGAWDIGADEVVVVATGQPSRKRMGGIPWGISGVHVW